MSSRRRVALLIETSNEYARGILHGIRTYIVENEPWLIDMAEMRRGESSLSWLSDWKGDGILARIETKQIATAVLKTGLPAVDLSAARHIPELPMVETDDRAITRLAADHLIERGLQHFGFAGDDQFCWSQYRQEYFGKAIRKAGFDCSFYKQPTTKKKQRTWVEQLDAIEAWLKALPKPVGIMACYDYRGRQILEACQRAGFAVPRDVAVVGVDNDELLCDLAEPSMTSIMPDADRTGYVAAELLDRMMKGERVEPESILIEPVSIVARRSTDFIAIEDPDIVKAVEYIRERACQGINVEDVLEHVGLSRRSLDHRFAKLIGCTPHEEIVRVQMDRVKKLLIETDLNLSDIAERTGFRHVEYMSVVVKKRLGVPPSDYRRQHRR